MNNTLTAAAHLADEALTDRALVAIFLGYHRNSDGNGQATPIAWERLDTLSARGWVKTESRDGGASPLVWLTEEGHEVIGDIEEEGVFEAHSLAIRRRW